MWPLSSVIALIFCSGSNEKSIFLQWKLFGITAQQAQLKFWRCYVLSVILLLESNMRSFHYLPCRIFNLFCRNRMTRNLNVKNCMFCELLQFWKISNTNNGRKNFKLGFNTLLRLEMFAHHNNSVIRNSCLRSNSGKKTTMLIHREYGPSMKQSIHSFNDDWELFWLLEWNSNRMYEGNALLEADIQRN